MSKLDSYISKLLSDDDALKEFLVDPIKAAEDDHGLTKGQRSVLRRVVANLSNNATNGYSIVRHLESYRRSIRLLQNVLHLERGAAVNEHTKSDAAAKDQVLPIIKYTFYVYYNGDPSNPTGSISNPGAQYANYHTYYAYASAGSDVTLEDLMNIAYDSAGNKMQYTKQSYNGNEAVTSFTIPGSGTYNAPPQPVNTRTPFWYFSTGGKAITNQGGGYYYNSASGQGGPDNTFTNYKPNNQIIYWQVIAPDTSYGFAPCDTASKEKVFS
jgi:hypothetical protein